MIQNSRIKYSSQNGPLRSNAVPSYSVKYLGIVDGSMGILSRKMAMQGMPKDQVTSAAELVQVNKKLATSFNDSYQTTGKQAPQADIQIKTFG
mmetsp:Transcript_17782/g.30122  ORF Transcript_17782/g.30122 Transcript_17782/m.30122 type:complete len:93 (+) Transcript_17782:3-281(+)